MFFKALLTTLTLLAATQASAAPITEAEVEDAMMASDAGQLYAAVKTYFPEDAAYWRTELTKLAKRKSGEIVMPRKAIAIGAEIRKRHAPALKHASDDHLRAVMVVQYDLHATFKDNPGACNRMILSGPSGLSVDELNKVGATLGNAGPLFAAMHAGQANPVQHAAPDQTAWQGFYDTYRAFGYSNADYDLILEPKDHPTLCNAFLGFLRVLRDGQFEGADTVRAVIVPGLIGS